MCRKSNQVTDESKSNTDAAKQASFMKKGAFQEAHHDAQSKNPFKNGQLFTLVTQVSINVHQFILFYVQKEQSSLIMRLLSTLIVTDESKSWNWRVEV